ncbi:hypothetical protein DL239_17620 [Sedimentitalea sp. CY04]|uniref:Uncharacterized protein n=1 Tax=Parasedimentitalea denitrificans TaxID=2211118 RepID=A0ABX0WES8_9RHOB|nr:hypothetical protein [Sedimentitalea sp. CY04]NIZ62791.1 hypothetical protein [Sedimentitalea sp. CY04]
MGGREILVCRPVLFINLIVASLSFVSFAGEAEAENYCENQWLEMVSNIEREIPPDTVKKKGLLFSGDDGRIFNCLDIALPDSALQELQFWEIARSRSISSDPLYENSLPPNFCNSSFGVVQGVQIMIIYLPYDGGELGSQACTVRLSGIPNRAKQFFMKE